MTEERMTDAELDATVKLGLRDLFFTLPANRDWMDPMTEKMLRAALKELETRESENANLSHAQFLDDEDYVERHNLGAI